MSKSWDNCAAVRNEVSAKKKKKKKGRKYESFESDGLVALNRIPRLSPAPHPV